MDQETQIQAIVGKLTGAPPETLPPPAAFCRPWRTIFRRVRRAETLAEARVLIARAALEFEDWEHVASQLLARLPPEDAFGAYPSLHELSDQFADVDWLWPYWIPRGMVTLLGAAPGAGKSLVALDLARRVIHGFPFPDGAPCLLPGANVLIVDAEGAPALLHQRARAWGIDSRRLYLMQAPNRVGLIDLSHPHQQKTFYGMCRRLEPALVVIDSLGAATARGEASLQAARDIMGFLAAVARKERLALLVIHHLRKRATAGTVRVAADDLRGSSHISAAARSVLALSVVAGTHVTPGAPPHPAAVQPVPAVQPTEAVQLAEPAQPASAPQHSPPIDVPDPLLLVAAPQEEGPGSRVGGPRLLEIVKTNLCRRPPPLGLIIEGDGLGVPTLRYTRYVEPAPEPTRTDLCASWLFHYLDAAGGPVKPAAAIVAAREAGYSRATLYRARKILGGLVVDLGDRPRDPDKLWTLAATISEIDIKKR